MTTHNDAMATAQHSKIHYTGRISINGSKACATNADLEGIRSAHDVGRPFDRGFGSTDPGGRVTKLLGRSPPSYDDFAWETAALWKY